MAFTATHFYVGNTDAVLRWSYRKGQSRRLDGAGERITELPGSGYNQHWTRNVRVSPDGAHLFVTVGSAGNNDEEEPPRAAVLRMKLDGSEREVFADGLRNPVGLDFEPRTGEVYVTVNERDRLGDDLVPDYMTRIRAGEFFGWPWAYLSPRHLDPRWVKDGASTRPDEVARTTTPDVLIQAHSAALGLAFYRGDAFPPKYRRAPSRRSAKLEPQHGHRYQIVFIPVGENGRRSATTALRHRLPGRREAPGDVGPSRRRARPADGLLFTEEENQQLDRVTYRPS
jgi:glucose/arabinose dehydrogenase